jgi:uncharacterized membrane protein YccC
MDDVLKIALGVFIGALAAAFTWEGIQTVRVEMALKKATDEMKRASQQARADQQAEQAAQQMAQEAQAKDEQERQKQNQEAAQLQRLRQHDKEEAWKQFFKPTASCLKDAVQAECANAHMRAKTIFESQYQPTR